MTVVIVPFDMIKVDGACNARQLIKLPQVVGEMRKIFQSLPVTFEVAMINAVEAN